MRGQGYDGVANMAGKHRGVKDRIHQRISLATYTLCHTHSLNLAIVHACREPLIRNLINTEQTIAFAFDYPVKRLLSLKENLENDADAKEEIERKTKLKTLLETRWFSRVHALTSFLQCFSVVISSLQDLAVDGDSKAGSYVYSICPAGTPQYRRRYFSLRFIDHLITELTDRLVLPEHRFIA